MKATDIKNGVLQSIFTVATIISILIGSWATIKSVGNSKDDLKDYAEELIEKSNSKIQAATKGIVDDKIKESEDQIMDEFTDVKELVTSNSKDIGSLKSVTKSMVKEVYSGKMDTVINMIEKLTLNMDPIDAEMMYPEVLKEYCYLCRLALFNESELEH